MGIVSEWWSRVCVEHAASLFDVGRMSVSVPLLQHI